MGTEAALSSETLVEFRQALEAFDLDEVWPHLAPYLPGVEGSATQRNYRSGVKEFIGWAQTQGHALLRPGEAMGGAYLAHLHARYAGKPSTLTTRLSQARALYRVLRKLGLVPRNLDPFSALERPTVQPGAAREYYTNDELTRLLAHGTTEQRALVLLGAHGGLTTSEVLSVHWSQIQLQRGELIVHGRAVHASEELLEALRAYARTQGVGDLFTSEARVFDIEGPTALRSQLYRLCKAANVSYRAWRALRHYAGLRLYLLTGNAERVRQELGLVTLQLTEPYRRKVEEGT
ncbi:tyrosine-type recombinase/integrase [Deinococcus maricopensis]|uniref:Integrase domain protein SAM domain protein n=1 Tax=Deinococcus maricopensis (strain DSM 21211 / LMG 22137 / NRRL B-23946 / LB-34) TaxID=709986 RepID=E8U3G5_DEIML|nr:site-specific integrase [Deinococcus maricopensis]ADV65836.1 integrase domain protein SAM domain protein [Deinococcus maricopensis DSM 21211]